MVARMKEAVFLYGPPGVGKSTVGYILAERLHQPFVDLDSEIERFSNQTIPEIFSSKGEAHFRNLEREMLLQIKNGQSGIFALGGGTLLTPYNRDLVESLGKIICLQTDFEHLVTRLASSQSTRPLIEGDLPEKLQSLISSREQHYNSFPIQIQTANVSPHEVVWEIQKRLGWFHIEGMGKSYDVRIGSGAIEFLGKSNFSESLKGKLFLVTDKNVDQFHSQKVINTLSLAGINLITHVIEPGEKHKNLTTVQSLWGAFLDAGLERGSTVAAFGGGVIGDLTGFAAATYMRGIDWINIPTTLLAMVDASIGGKTGIDLPQGKNLIGAFHSPQKVLIDPTLLTTLPENELRAGMAEVIKHGIIGSPELFEMCKSGIPATLDGWAQLISEAISVKVNVIQEDPFEMGRRAVLNFGHTVGHAIELLSHFSIPHGFAVAIGMMIESQIARQIGLVDSGFLEELHETLTKLALPTKAPNGIDTYDIINAMSTDKKTQNGNIRFSLPVNVGQIEYGIVIDDLTETLSEALMVKI